MCSLSQAPLTTLPSLLLEDIVPQVAVSAVVLDLAVLLLALALLALALRWVRGAWGRVWAATGEEAPMCSLPQAPLTTLPSLLAEDIVTRAAVSMMVGLAVLLLAVSRLACPLR